MPDYKQRFFETDAIAAQLRESCIQMSTEILEVLYPKISSLEKEAAGAYLRGFNAAKEQVSKLLLDNFTCADYPRCDHEWCAYLLELSDAIQQMQTEEVK